MGYESLFTPFKIGNMEVKNRIGLSPMGTNSAFTNGRKDARKSIISLKDQKEEPVSFIWDVKC